MEQHQNGHGEKEKYYVPHHAMIRMVSSAFCRFRQDSIAFSRVLPTYVRRVLNTVNTHVCALSSYSIFAFLIMSVSQRFKVLDEVVNPA